MTRAIGRTLVKVWDADLSLRDLRDGGSRLSDLALIEDRVRATLPPVVLTPRDLPLTSWPRDDAGRRAEGADRGEMTSWAQISSCHRSYRLLPARKW